MDKEKTLEESLLDYELEGPDFLTYVARPINAGQIGTWSDLSSDGGDGTAIVIHGPMVYDQHFTRETIRLYQQHYPKALIILSTWDDEDHDYLDDFQEQNLLVVTRAKPENTGIGDSELTRIPAHAGVTAAAQHKVNHVLLTRTDQRMYAPNLIEYFKTLQNCFPLKKEINQQGRIIASAYGSRKYCPLCVSTLCMFGHCDDLARYWDAPPDRREPQPASDNAKPSILEYVASVPDHYFLTNYLDMIGVDYANTVADSWRIMTDYFCLADKEMLDLCWRRDPSSPQHAIERLGNWYGMQAIQLMTFRDWLMLYNHRDRIDSAPEFILNIGMRDTIEPRHYDATAAHPRESKRSIGEIYKA